jgi:hypothetical protein
VLPHLTHTGDAALTMRDCMRHARVLCVRLPSTLMQTRQRDAPRVSVEQSKQGRSTGMGQRPLSAALTDVDTRADW